MSAMPHVTSIVARILNGPTLPAVAVPTSVITDPFPIDPVVRSLMPHEAITLSSRGTRIGDDGLVSNHDATAAWKLGLIAIYFGAAELYVASVTSTWSTCTNVVAASSSPSRRQSLHITITLHSLQTWCQEPFLEYQPFLLLIQARRSAGSRQVQVLSKQITSPQASYD